MTFKGKYASVVVSLSDHLIPKEGLVKSGVIGGLGYSHFKVLDFFPYRTAEVYESVIDLPRDLLSAVEAKMAEALGVQPDNHCVFAVQNYFDKEVLFIWCSDHHFRIGKRLVLSEQRLSYRRDLNTVQVPYELKH